MKMYRFITILLPILLCLILLTACAAPPSASAPEPAETVAAPAAVIAEAAAGGLSVRMELPAGWLPLYRGDAEAYAAAYPLANAEYIPMYLEELETDGFVLEAVGPGSTGGGGRNLLLRAFPTADARLDAALQGAEVFDDSLVPALEAYLTALPPAPEGECEKIDLGGRSWLVCDASPNQVRYAAVEAGHILLAQFDCREGVSAGDRASVEAALSTLACTALP